MGDSVRLIREIIPFRALTLAQISALVEEMTITEFSPGEDIAGPGVDAGAGDDRRVFLLAAGEVETLDVDRTPPFRLNLINAGHYFGEQPALFDIPRKAVFRAAGNTPATVLAVSGDRFLQLIGDSPPFAQALGSILRVKQGVFQSLDNFLAELLYGVSLGTISLFRLIPLYRKLEPALHPHANDPHTIDFRALFYAIRRLPENITRTFMIFLTDDIPPLYAQPQHNFKPIPTAARPRTTYQMIDGKNMILLRDGLSDLVDFITCICLFCVEARKIRRRLNDPRQLLDIRRFLKRQTIEDTAFPNTSRERQRAFLKAFPFRNEEIDAFTRIWPDNPAQRLEEILLQHEDFGIGIRKQLHNYNSRPAEAWVHQIADDVRALCGYDPGEMPPDMSVHIISSNTHSITNCLNHYLQQHKNAVYDWGRKHREELCAIPWSNPDDLLYALSRDYFRTHPSENDIRLTNNEPNGLLRRQETAFTGIQVDLVNLTRLHGGPIDPGLKLPPLGKQAVLVNIDFAFGQQAEEILANLVMLFHRNLRSINILGKAGTLVGRRGDILVPTGFIEQQSDQYHPLDAPPAVRLDRLRHNLPNHALHRGPMLTVLGTLMQNRMLLNFFRRVWGCIGLEMEGYYYHKVIHESIQRKVLSPDIPLRILYYVSDNPLSPGETLSESLSESEGIPPLYAITREILQGIFDQTAEESLGRGPREG